MEKEKIDLSLIEKICSSRPKANREIDQVHMRSESIVSQLEIMENYVMQKDILFLGDDDFLSVFSGIFLKPKSITVLEIDKRIIDSLIVQGKMNSLELKVYKYGVGDKLPSNFQKKFDFFVTNPPYGSKNKGESGKIFLGRCLEATKKNGLGCFILPYDPDIDWTKEAMLNIQQMLVKSECVMLEVARNTHKYFHPNKNLTSSAYIIQKLSNLKPFSYDKTFKRSNLY